MGWLTGLIIGPYWLALQAVEKVKSLFGSKTDAKDSTSFPGKPTDETQTKTKP